MDAPRFSVGLPQSFDGGDPRPVGIYAARAETLGFSGLWTLDSAVGGPTSRTPLLDGLQVLAYAAAVTRDIRLGIAVIVMNRRQPVLLAKEIASLDRLSGGRLTVGVGLGAPADEHVAALGFPADRTVRRLVEGVEVMRALWSGDEVSFDGELLRFSRARLEPRPIQRPGPPVWFGAGREPALERAARLGDGWIGAGSSSAADFAARSRSSATRSPGPAATRSTSPSPSASTSPSRTTSGSGCGGCPRSSTRCTAGPGSPSAARSAGRPSASRETVRALVAAGCQEVSLTPMYGHLAQLERLPEVVRLATVG